MLDERIQPTLQLPARKQDWPGYQEGYRDGFDLGVWAAVFWICEQVDGNQLQAAIAPMLKAFNDWEEDEELKELTRLVNDLATQLQKRFGA